MSIIRHSRRLVVMTTAMVATITVATTSCKRSDQAQQGGYPQQGYPQQGYPQQPVAMAPAFGFFCQTDNDLQCAYGRCLGGRCGGCSDASQCKGGTQCAASPVGGTCWPVARNNVPPPQPPPQPPPPPPAQPGPTPTQPPPFPAPPSSDPFANARQSCVDRINAYRARSRLPALARDGASEPCADEESRLDARSNRAHGSFGKCGERAQNACPNYPGASVEDVLTKCLQQMFEEGPGGGHYDNMMNQKYTRAFCGFESMAGGRIWTVQNFR